MMTSPSNLTRISMVNKLELLVLFPRTTMLFEPCVALHYITVIAPL
jgi:hypothetical protein